MTNYNTVAWKRAGKNLAGHIVGGAITGVLAYFTASPYWFILEPLIQTVVNSLAKRLRAKYSIETVL